MNARLAAWGLISAGLDAPARHAAPDADGHRACINTFFEV
jgi:hypothetical protein